MTEESPERGIEEVLTEMVVGFARHEIVAMSTVGPLAERLLDRPDEWIGTIQHTYETALDEASRDPETGESFRVWEAFTGGPLETIPWAVYNTVGAVYPYLTRDQKDEALQQVLNILDGINSGIVSGDRGIGHTTGIREPLLFADIILPRAHYGPSEQYRPRESQARRLIDRFGDFEELQHTLMTEDGVFDPKKVQSDYLLGHVLLRPDCSDHSESYVSVANPSFLRRVVNGVVAIQFGWDVIKGNSAERWDEFRKYITPAVHDLGAELREERDWVDLRKFRPELFT